MVTRRALFTYSRQTTTDSPLPPWSGTYSVFSDLCTQCGDCIGVCPPQVISKDDSSGYVTVDFSQSGCDFCGKCADACEPKAINRQANPVPWLTSANINQNCLNFQKSFCQSCIDICAETAIHFLYSTKFLSGQAVIHSESCTGCGECVSACPANAIVMQPS